MRWDSNPRTGFSRRRFSRPVPSTTRAPIQKKRKWTRFPSLPQGGILKGFPSTQFSSNERKNLFVILVFLIKKSRSVILPLVLFRLSILPKWRKSFYFLLISQSPLRKSSPIPLFSSFWRKDGFNGNSSSFMLRLLKIV